jgi:hypothetical protein
MGGGWNQPLEKAKYVGEQIGTGLFDVATLGQAYSARKAGESQEDMLKNMKDQQNAQLDALNKQGAAPKMELPSELEKSTNKRKRLEALRAGMSSTINTNPSGVVGSGNVNIASGKQKLGA